MIYIKSTITDKDSCFASKHLLTQCFLAAIWKSITSLLIFAQIIGV